MLKADTTAAALDVLRVSGLLVDSIVYDGEIHRPPTQNRPNSKNGWYRAYPDGQTVLYGDWASGETMTWTAKEKSKMTASEKAEFARRMDESRRQREEKQARIHAEAAKKAQAIYAAAADCTGHPYLERKKVNPVSGLKLHNSGSLIVPLYDEAGAVVSLQFITDAEKDNKRFLTDGRKTGCFFPIGGKDAEKPLLICEGLATGLSLYECTGNPVLVAFDAGNLLPVAELARARYSERLIILCADNDTETEGNPGVTKATAAAVAVGGSLAVPRHEGRTVDWNDLHTRMGKGEVTTQFMTHKKPDAPIEARAKQEEEPFFPDSPVPFEGMEAPPIDIAILPESLKVFVSAVSEAVQVAAELPLLNALSSMAVAVQGRVQVVIHDDYKEPLNLYALVALPPGERKSSVVELCKRPLRDWEKEARAAMQDVRREAEANRRSLEKVIEGKRNTLTKSSSADLQKVMAEIRQLEAELPQIPELPRLFADDATPEAAAALLAKQGERIGIQEAEGGIFDILAGRYTNGNANIDLFLKAWGGEPVTVDRKKGEDLRLEHPLLTICISPQPDVIKSLSDKPGFRGRGLLARFLYLLPQSRVGFRNIQTAPIPPQAKALYAGKMRAALALQPSVMADGAIIPYELTLSPQAEVLRLAFAEHVEKSMRVGGELETMRDWANKIPGNAIRLAGLLHFFAEDSPLAAPISEKTMSTAIEIAAVMVDHAKMAFALMEDIPAITGAKKILEWIQDEGREKFTTRECWMKFRGSFDVTEEVKASLAVLKDRGFITEAPTIQSGKAGRKSEIWLVHPSVIGGAQ